MRVLGLLCRSVNQARIRRRVLRLELLNRFEIGRVGHDFRKLLQLLQLTQSCFGLLLLNNGSAHDNSFLSGLTQNVRPNKRSTTTNSRRNTFRCESKGTRGVTTSVKQMPTLPKAPQSFVANQSRRGQNYFQVPTCGPGLCRTP